MRINRLLCSSLAWVIFNGSISSALGQGLKLNCVQQSRHMCEQGKGCKNLQDAMPNRWTFELDLDKQLGRVLRCAGRDCGSPFEVRAQRRATGEEFTSRILPQTKRSLFRPIIVNFHVP